MSPDSVQFVFQELRGRGVEIDPRMAETLAGEMAQQRAQLADLREHELTEVDTLLSPLTRGRN